MSTFLPQFLNFSIGFDGFLKIILEHSLVLTTLMENKKGCEDCVIDMPEVSGAGGYALLQYFSTNAITSALDSSIIALELFQAAHAYGMGPLKQRLKRLLKEKHFDWYGLGGAIKLFQFVREVECCTDMKRKVAQLLKT